MVTQVYNSQSLRVRPTGTQNPPLHGTLSRWAQTQQESYCVFDDLLDSELVSDDDL